MPKAFHIMKEQEQKDLRFKVKAKQKKELGLRVTRRQKVCLKIICCHNNLLLCQ
jgi:hypothetical protein